MTVLDTHLWSLRAEVEAQLRTLTEVHRQLNRLPRRDDPQWHPEVTRIGGQLEQLLQGIRMVRELCAAAVVECRALAALVQPPG